MSTINLRSDFPDDFRDANPQIPWRQIVAMRHILVHQYFGIDRDAVWSVVEKDLPVLSTQLARLLDT